MPSGGGALQMQRNAKVDHFLRFELGKEKGGRQMEELPHVSGQ